MNTASLRAVRLLRERGAADIEHPGGKLLSHLLRTHDVLREWEASEALRLAGLCHAAYGTDGFRTSLFDLDERDTLRSVIGARAEHIVYVYCACARSDTYARLGALPLPLKNRFTGELHLLEPDDAADFAVLSIGNELDFVRAGNLTDAAADAIGNLFQALSHYAPDASAAALSELR
jgi:hypothetical protein